MTNKIFIGLDRDGVINTDLGHYCTHPRDFEPIPGSLESIANLRHQGYGIVIITNQGGIAKGQMSIEDVESVNNYMLDLLGKAGCTDIDGIYFSETSEKNVANKSKIDIVFGHSHRAQDVRIPKISNIKNDFTRILNLGCALPHNHIEKYARHSLTGWTYQVCEIDIWDNHIQQVKNVSM